MGRFLQAWCIGSILILVFVSVQGLLVAGTGFPGAALVGGKIAHVLWGFLSTIVVLFAHTISMFYFIGTGSAVKGEARKHAALVPLYQKTRSFKARTSGILTLAPLLLMAASIAGAGTAGGSVSPRVHLWMEIVAVLFNLWTLYKVTGVIGENMVLMTEANRIVTEATELAEAP